MSSVIKAESVDIAYPQDVHLVDYRATAKRKWGRRKKSSTEDQAQVIISQAEEEATDIIARAHLEAEEIKSSAYQEGFETALKELETAQSDLKQRGMELEADAVRQVEDFWRIIEPDLLRLSVDIAGKILRREIPENQDFVINTIKAGLVQLREKRELKIRLNPSDYEFAREHKEEIVTSFDGMQSLELIEDRRVDEGGCIIESENGHLDARIGSQLAQTEKALLEALHDGGDSATQP